MIYFLIKGKLVHNLTINNLQINTVDKNIVLFEIPDSKEVGAIWFIAKVGGYKKAEIGMFTEILYKYMDKNFGKEHTVNPDYCYAVDVVSSSRVTYSELLKKEVPAILNRTIAEVNGLLVPS